MQSWLRHSRINVMECEIMMHGSEGLLESSAPPLTITATRLPPARGPFHSLNLHLNGRYADFHAREHGDKMSRHSGPPTMHSSVMLSRLSPEFRADIHTRTRAFTFRGYLATGYRARLIGALVSMFAERSLPGTYGDDEGDVRALCRVGASQYKFVSCSLLRHAECGGPVRAVNMAGCYHFNLRRHRPR